MKTLRLILLCLCLTPLLALADEQSPVFDEAAWTPVFARLREGTPLFSTFNEERHYTFRRVPLALTGELRFIPGRGLSLHYLTPEVATLIVDDRGLLMRDDRGRERVAPSDHRAQGTAHALLQLMRFDLDGLRADFDLSGSPAPEGWTLVLTPRDADLASSLGTITVTGHDDRVSTIVMQKTPRQHIDITVTSATPRTEFTAEDIARYFR